MDVHNRKSPRQNGPRLSRHVQRIIITVRCIEGIANAKERGVYKGRKATINPAKIKKMKTDGMGPSAIAKALKIGRASVYRALAE
jgi:DNA invertase Pin-like site-specific DNA recombinase